MGQRCVFFLFIDWCEIRAENWRGFFFYEAEWWFFQVVTPAWPSYIMHTGLNPCSVTQPSCREFGVSRGGGWPPSPLCYRTWCHSTWRWRTPFWTRWAGGGFSPSPPPPHSLPIMKCLIIFLINQAAHCVELMRPIIGGMTRVPQASRSKAQMYLPAPLRHSHYTYEWRVCINTARALNAHYPALMKPPPAPLLIKIQAPHLRDGLQPDIF